MHFGKYDLNLQNTNSYMECIESSHVIWYSSFIVRCSHRMYCNYTPHDDVVTVFSMLILYDYDFYNQKKLQLVGVRVRI